MSQVIYRYDFGPSIDLQEVEATIVLAILAAEALNGEAATQLGLAHFLDPDKRACVVDAGTVVGRQFNMILLGLLKREFGASAFRMKRVTPSSTFQTVAA